MALLSHPNTGSQTLIDLSLSIARVAVVTLGLAYHVYHADWTSKLDQVALSNSTTDQRRSLV